ncbi:MAG: DNA-binding response OmpR family regulator [Gammaproteobacteria bacterium]|jgi:DNA-binding response OmpR family regulator
MNRKMRILIVEDEPAIRSGLEDVFVYHGYEVESAADGADGYSQACSGRFDLLLLDVMLPSMNGFEICDRIRSIDREQAIIMLTARTGDDDIIEGLKLGADDYIAKPFSVQQLVLRVEAVLRRSRVGVEQARTLALGDLVSIDVHNLTGQRGDDTLSFTRREMDMLLYLAANSDRAVARDELLNKVWGYAKNLDLETRTVDIHVAKLRRKIEPDASVPRFLLTVRGAGYRLQTE